MPLRSIARLVSLALILFATPAAAIGCQEWKRLGPGQKEPAVYDLIETAVSGSRGRQYQVNRGAIERCLRRNARNIAYEFDDICADSRRASMQALNKLFKNYIWTCVG
ncbi:MAG: hypothetical protein IH974_02220 [Myxococcales bacterium]|nr:hypothetical protein [Myxococcales bacterium]